MSAAVAILGAGIGREHLAAYLSLADRFHIRWICDLNLDLAAQLAARAPGCKTTAALRDVLDDPTVDIVDICLPPKLHVPVTLAALAAGKHVICEKPIAGNLRDGDRVVQAARDSGRIFMPVFQYRYGAAFDDLAALKSAGLLGRPLVGTLETHWNRDAAYYAVPWRGKWAHELGGVVASHAIHIHDLMSCHLGAPIEVSAMLDTRVNEIETEDCAALSFRTDAGALVTSSITLGAASDSSRLRLVFDKLTAESGRVPYAPGQGEWRFTARAPARQGDVDRALAQARRGRGNAPQGFAGLFFALSERLQRRDGALVTPEDGLRSVELVSAIYQSARSGQVVRLPLDRALPVAKSWLPEEAP